ncbi:MAG TPA: copper chaperone PCu(A)C [Xanthobacteraceae bacterium]|nr:copper chaperone PCu(A)C [Xanthobacteraceae bacterium]
MFAFPFAARAAHIAAVLALFAAPAAAHEFKVGPLDIAHPWARMTPAGAQVGGGYLTVTNHGTAPDRLTGATAEVAERVEIHEMAVKDGIMTMRMLTDGVEVPPGATVALAPGGLHMMLLGLKRPLVQGQRFKGTLSFAQAGTVAVEFAIEGMAGPKEAAAPAGHEGHTMPAPSN